MLIVKICYYLKAGVSMYSEINVGERIKFFRNKLGWSQEKLALQAEINTAFLGHLERGLKNPTIKTLEKITFALGVSLSEFFEPDIEITDEKEVILSHIHNKLKDLPLESINKIDTILQNVLTLEK